MRFLLRFLIAASSLLAGVCVVASLAWVRDSVTDHALLILMLGVAYMVSCVLYCLAQ